MKQWLTRAWYNGSLWVKLLYPLSLLFGWISRRRRRRLLEQGPYQAGVPVIVVGNISVGGTGKTPLCLALTRYFVAAGHKVALVSRGYGGTATQFPLVVTSSSNAVLAGDEALLLARRSRCPVIVDPNRANAVRHAEAHFQPDLIISDDGLQHYAMGRSVEIAVLDGARGIGNGLLLPAGPLREPATRLHEVDFVVVNGELKHKLPVALPTTYTMTLQPTHLVNLRSGERLTADYWLQQYGSAPAHAVAGIGNPSRFFDTLQQLGFGIMPHAFADHHAFTAGDFAFGDTRPVVMTAKDAVKCQTFAQEHWWSLEVQGELPPLLLGNLLACLRSRGLKI